MDTLSFLQKILPSQGVYVLAAFRNGMDRSPAHYNCKSLEDLARLARKVDDAGVQVFHACASFAEERKVPTKADPSKLRNATRAADNVAFTRSQWLDVDVGPTKDYPTRKEAVQAVAELCRTLRIPAPMFVASGRGLHCYWPFTKDLPAVNGRHAHTTSPSAFVPFGKTPPEYSPEITKAEKRNKRKLN